MQALVRGGLGVVLCTLAGCTAAPQGNQDAGPTSQCGYPGDRGNSLGIGKYCQQSRECPNTAPICSSVANSGNQNTFFCVLPCDPCNVGQCAENATCECQGPGECGCTPNVCLSNTSRTPPSCNPGGSDGGQDAGGSDAGTNSGTDAGPCVPSPAGTCAPTACSTGNASHVGAYCTKGGNECLQYFLLCAIDLSPDGANFCISVGCQQNSDCGSDACCTGQADSGVTTKACVPSQCLVPAGTSCPAS